MIYAFHWTVLRNWYATLVWMLLLALLAFLMVSTWRYRSFKDFNLLRPRSPLIAIIAGGLIYLIWNWSEPMLLTLGIVYVGSGIAVRIGGLLRRAFRGRNVPPPTPAGAEQRLG